MKVKNLSIALLAVLAIVLTSCGSSEKCPAYSKADIEDAQNL
jgi:uncharacterized lipoprotein YehR (DUF1307 family)